MVPCSSRHGLDNYKQHRTCFFISDLSLAREMSLTSYSSSLAKLDREVGGVHPERTPHTDSFSSQGSIARSRTTPRTIAVDEYDLCLPA